MTTSRSGQPSLRHPRRCTGHPERSTASSPATSVARVSPGPTTWSVAHDQAGRTPRARPRRHEPVPGRRPPPVTEVGSLSSASPPGIEGHSSLGVPGSARLWQAGHRSAIGHRFTLQWPHCEGGFAWLRLEMAFPCGRLGRCRAPLSDREPVVEEAQSRAAGRRLTCPA